MNASISKAKTYLQNAWFVEKFLVTEDRKDPMKVKVYIRCADITKFREGVDLKQLIRCIRSSFVHIIKVQFDIRMIL